MKKYVCLLLLLAFLSGCTTAPQGTPTPTEAPTPEVTLTPEPTSTPEPLTAEQAAEIYIHFLKNEIPCHEGDHSLYYSDFSRTEEIPITGFYIRDLTGDGLPELYAPDWKWPSIPVWSIQNGELTAIHSGSSYDTLLANGGIFTYVSGTAQSDVYAYCWLSPESREYPEISFEAYDMDSDGEMDSFYIDSAEVTRSEWEARTAPYFALREAEPTEEQKALPFLQWAAELGADISEFLDLEPWQAAYLELLAGYETRRAEYSADAQELYMERYALYDIDKDGIPELFLIHGLADDGSGTRGTGDAWFSCDLYTAQNGKFVHLKPNPEDNNSFWFGSLYSCPGENAVLYGEGKNFRKVSIIDGKRADGPNLPLSEDIPYEQITAQLFVPETEELARYEPTDLQPILDYPAANIYGIRGEAVELSRADFSVYDHVLSPEEQETLESFLPVLTGKEPLTPDWKDGERILLTDWFKELLGDEPGDFPSVFNAFALCDMDGDGAQELILWIHRYGGCYTILHREKSTVYGTYMSVRQFQELQTDGVYASTGGMGNRSYQQAYFENGKLLDKDLGCTRYNGEGELVHYFIGEREVSEAEFEAWLKETMVGDVVWYAAREKKEVTP